MVNPVTGDFVYSLPLLEVPGPEGSYPLSLSYHAGINPEQESSWVGLGWTLNPGSITRQVNGFPDDWANTQASRRDYWAGGVTNVTSVGVTIPLANYGSVNLGLVKASDTYRGVGYGWNVGYTFGVGGSYSPFSVSVGIGSNPFSSGLTLSGGVGVGFDQLGNSSLSLSGSVGETNGIGISVSAPYGILGASLASNGGFSFSAVGYSGSLTNSNEGVVRTETSSSTLNLVLLRYSNTRTRYWTDETETSKIYGVLNANQDIDLPMASDVVNDSYHLPQRSILDGMNPEKEQGGAFPAFDSYTVTGQGIGGAIRPYMFQGGVTKQNVIERESATSRRETVQYGNFQPNLTGLGFRFVGDFSNSLLQDYAAFSPNSSAIKFSAPPFSSIPTTSLYGVQKYQPTNQNLVGSKSITYFQTGPTGTINSISGKSKFITPVALGLNRTKHAGPIVQGRDYAGIAGFAITNENGMTYHYNLPAYNYGEEIYQENKNQTSGLRFNRQTKSAGYAYTWHLTAITGPDYVDRGTAGVLDEADYGYWVSFEYGKWNDEFVWRTPTEGFTENFDEQFKTVSMGKKEVYYLNSIKTRTHTAFFEKEARTDGKSASIESFNKNWSTQNSVSTDYNNTGVYNVNSTQSLRLSHIYILKNGTYSNLGSSLGGGSGLVSSGRTVACNECELPNNVFDLNDVNTYGRTSLESKSLRVIDLNYDYSLAKGSTTSFNFASPGSKLGKLTLKTMKVRGKGGISYLPATEFGYDLPLADQKKGSGTINNGTITGANVQFEEGDLIETDETVPIYCGYIEKVTQIGASFDYVIKGAVVGSLGAKNIRRTKNPPFLKDKYDYWGMFKSDHFASSEKNINRIPNRISAKSVDVWSLRRIKTTTGAVVDVGYEAHDFSKTVYASDRSIWFTSMEVIATNLCKVSFGNITDHCRHFFEVGTKYNAYFFRSYLIQDGPPGTSYRQGFDLYGGTPVEIMDVQSDYITIKLDEYQIRNILNIGDGRYDNTNVNGVNFSASALNTNKYGGAGVRVKSITLTSLDGIKNNNMYSYGGETSYISSGSVIYEPLALERFKFSYSLDKYFSDLYTKQLNPDIDESVRYAGELPGPGVMYSRVSTTSEIEYPDKSKNLSSQRTISEFFSFSDLKISFLEATPSESSGSSYSTRNLVMRKFISLLGAPKSVSHYDGNGKLMKRMVKQYLHEGIAGDFFTDYKVRLQKFGYQGLLTERFSEVKNVYNNSYNDWVTFGTMTAREDYPLVNIGTVEYDYIHNTKTSSKVNAFDFFSGAITESISTDSYGNNFLSVSTPAYRDFVEMGPSQLTDNRKNMLTQISSSNVYRLNAAGTPEYLVSANYNIWSNGASILDENGNRIVQNSNASANGNVWRQTAGYVWMPSGVATNGMTAVGNFVAFPGSNPTGANAAWKKNSEVVLMDPYSHILSTKDFKGNEVSTRYGYNNAKPVLSGTFAKYGEMAFSSAEDENISNTKKLEVKKGTGTVSTSAFHTGKQSLQLTANQFGFEYSVPVSELTAARTYTASVWVYKGALNNVKLYYQLDGVDKVISAPSTVSTKTSGDWTLVNFDITLSGGTTVKVFAKNDGTTTTYVDDFRFQPKNGVSSASVYDTATGELTYMLDRNNLFTRYEYNVMGQLVATYREQFGRAPYKVSETQLNQSTRSFNGLPN
ncbi:hypothetical protein AAW12_23760 [Sphingobacterium sp. Ag1]|nr:hypothetical protein AAW12_23760 [Sphingobacterium sp. Ag1]